MVMQSAEERMRGDAPDPLNRAHRLRDDPTGSGTLRSAPPRHRRFGGRVRGFAPAGVGPRDLTQFPFTGVLGDALGGSYYWGASLELQTPLYFLPKDTGVKVAAYADAGSLWNYTGPTTFPATGEALSGNTCASWTPAAVPNAVPCPVDNAMHIRSSVGVGLIWDSPFGPLRFDYSVPLSKQPYDRVQQFRFGGGTKF